MEQAGRIVMHADLDAFFAAVEERDDPRLRGKPVIVGCDPKGGNGRGIVATCNYAARRFGVRSAMPISIAWRRCPQAVYLRPDFSRYSKASRAVMELLGARADRLEPAGIDEAYLEVSSLGSFVAARDAALKLQSDIRLRLGLSVSIGVGPNKLIAKLASDHRKPGGITVVIARRVQEFLDPKSVGALRGVGPVTREHLLALGYETVAALRQASQARLVGELGVFGAQLWRQARGIDESEVDPWRETKSIGREQTFDADTDDVERILATLEECVDGVCRSLVKERLWCRTLTVKVRFEGYETHSRQTTLRLATARQDLLSSAARALVEPFLRQGRRLRLVGFAVSKLEEPADALPL